MLEAGILSNDIPTPKERTRSIKVGKFLDQEIGVVRREDH